MFEYIFTIGCFDKLHKGHIEFLNNLSSKCEKLIIGIHDNASIEKIKGIADIQDLDIRKQNIKKYAFDIFDINDMDPTIKFKEYVEKNIINKINYKSPIVIGENLDNQKIIQINNFDKIPLFFNDDHNTYDYDYDNNSLIIKKINDNNGWDFNLIGYPINWCFMRGDDNQQFPGFEYISSIMPIKYLPYMQNISSTMLRNKNNKIGILNLLLQKVTHVLNIHNIPYYIDCGTLLGCVRDNEIMEKDTDVDVSVHLSMWDTLNAIDFSYYGLERTRTYTGYPDIAYSNMISVKTEHADWYCDIYTQPAFPLLSEKILNGNIFSIPIKPELYLKQLYGKTWNIPSLYHANTAFHRGNGLMNSEYSLYWDKNYELYECKI